MKFMCCFLACLGTWTATDIERQGEQFWNSEMLKNERIIELERLLADIKLKLKQRLERSSDLKNGVKLTIREN